jgi:hypothetical protein
MRYKHGWIGHWIITDTWTNRRAHLKLITTVAAKHKYWRKKLEKHCLKYVKVHVFCEEESCPSA